MQAMKFLGRFAGGDGLFQAGHRGFVPGGLLGHFVLFAQPVQRRAISSSSDGSAKSSPGCEKRVPLRPGQPAAIDVECRCAWHSGSRPFAAVRQGPVAGRHSTGAAAICEIKASGLSIRQAEFSSSAARAFRAVVSPLGNRLRHFPLQLLDPFLLEDPDILVPDGVFRVGSRPGSAGFRGGA